MQRTFGQIAYEAYCHHTGWKSLASGAALPPWIDLKPEIKDAWEASGSRVVREFLYEMLVEFDGKDKAKEYANAA